MVNYLDDRKLKKDLEVALKLEKLERDNRKVRKEARMNELTFQEASTIAFKPVTEAVMSLAEAVKPRPKGEQLLASEAPPEKPAIALEMGIENDKLNTFLTRTIAENVFRDNDSKYVLRTDDGKLFLNSLPVVINKNGYLMHDGTVYESTPGLEALLTSPSSSSKNANVKDEDIKSYLLMLGDSGIDLGKITAGDSRYKYLSKNYGVRRNSFNWYKDDKILLKNYGGIFGSGIKFLPSNTLPLRDMLGLRLAAYKAGKTGLRNEIIAISDELLRQKLLIELTIRRL